MGSAIVGCLDKMVDVVKPDDTVILFFSGHGKVPENQDMFYFIPSDFRQDNAAETGISAAMLAEKLRYLSARRIVLIIDACQSGAALDSLLRWPKQKLYSRPNFKTRSERLVPDPMITRWGFV